MLLERLRHLLAVSLTRPLAIRTTSQAPDGSTIARYRLILFNGATLILRVISQEGFDARIVAELEDCFFSHAVTEQIEAAADPIAAAAFAMSAIAMSAVAMSAIAISAIDATGSALGGKNHLNISGRGLASAGRAAAARHAASFHARSFALTPPTRPDHPTHRPASLLPTSRLANPSASHAPDDLNRPIDPAMPMTWPEAVRAVAREAIERYTILDTDAAALLPPDRPCAAGRQTASPASSAARFLDTQAWGFIGGEHGCKWAGLADPSPAAADGGPEQLRRWFEADQATAPDAPNRIARGRGRQALEPARTTRSAHQGELEPTRAGVRQSPRDAAADVSGFAASSFTVSPRWHLADLEPLPTPGSPARLPRLTDPFVRLPDLTRLLTVENVGASDAHAAAASYAIAAAIGRCRLFGIEDAPSTEFTLSPIAAIDAAHALSRRIERWVDAADALPEWADAVSEPLADDLRYGLIESRMEAWAAYVAIDEAYSAAIDSDAAADNAAIDSAAIDSAATDNAGTADDLSAAINTLLDGLAAFNESLEQIEPLLASALHSQMTANWLAALAKPYRECPPWWLTAGLQPASA